MTVYTVGTHEKAVPEAYPPLPSYGSAVSDGESIRRERVARRERKCIRSCLLAMSIFGILMTSFVLIHITWMVFFSNRHHVHFSCDVKYKMEKKDHSIPEKFEIDTKKQVEKIEVPKLGQGHAAMFVHDFMRNLTAIVDQLKDRCYIKPMNPASMTPPQGMIDLIHKIISGYYIPNSKRIKEFYQVRQKPLTLKQLKELNSPDIYEECQHYETYMLIQKKTGYSKRCTQAAYTHHNAKDLHETTVHHCQE